MHPEEMDNRERGCLGNIADIEEILKSLWLLLLSVCALHTAIRSCVSIQNTNRVYDCHLDKYWLHCHRPPFYSPFSPYGDAFR